MPGLRTVLLDGNHDRTCVVWSCVPYFPDHKMHLHCVLWLEGKWNIFSQKFCRLICWCVLWSCVLWSCVLWSCVLWSGGLILIDRDTKCFCVYFLTLTVWRMIQRNTIHSTLYTLRSTQYTVHSAQYTGISCYALIAEHLWHRVLHVSCVCQMTVIILIFTPCISCVWWYAAKKNRLLSASSLVTELVQMDAEEMLW
jgi:hypothetical protein